MFTRLLTGNLLIISKKARNFQTRSGSENCDYYDKPHGAVNKKGGGLGGTGGG